MALNWLTDIKGLIWQKCSIEGENKVHGGPIKTFSNLKSWKWKENQPIFIRPWHQFWIFIEQVCNVFKTIFALSFLKIFKRKFLLGHGKINVLFSLSLSYVFWIGNAIHLRTGTRRKEHSIMVQIYWSLYFFKIWN